MATDFAASQAGGADVRRGVRGRPSPWALLVGGSVGVLLAAAIAMATLWAATSDRASTSYVVTGATLGVELDVGRGNVEILGGSGGVVEVRRVDRSAFGHDPDERRRVANGVLRIESRCAALIIGSCGADYRVTVPESVPLRISARDGDVRLTAYRGSAQVATVGGAVTADAFCGFVLTATSRGGSIDVTALCAPERLELRSDSGDVTATVPPGRYAIDAATSTGRVGLHGLERAPNAPWTIQALSNSGDVTVEAGT